MIQIAIFETQSFGFRVLAESGVTGYSVVLNDISVFTR